LFLSDIFPTGFMAADFCNLKGGETVAVWGCGPVGQFAVKSAFLLGAERVIAIDTVPERLALAEASGGVTLDFKKEDIYDRIQELTNGRGADACIDAVGTEPDIGSGFTASKLRPSWARTARTFCGRQSTAAVILELFRSSASMVAYWITFRWDQRLTGVLLSAWPRLPCSIIYHSSSRALKRKKLTRLS
jgi:threonine dehydrogenase-like Zn-dependent dehydrogenase